MWENFYLLDLGGLLTENADLPEKKAMKEEMEAFLDGERLLKYSCKRNERAAMQSLGAGALLQLAVTEFSGRESGGRRSAEGQTDFFVRRFTAGTLLDELIRLKADAKRDIRYRYGAGGKPYFENLPFCFSLSHSEQAVFLAASEEEIGADVQCVRKTDWEALAKRFYGPEDQRKLRECRSGEEARELFFSQWTQKEAYGKLTGEGVTGILGQAVPGSGQGLDWRLARMELGGEDYFLAVCKRMEKEQRTEK